MRPLRFLRTVGPQGVRQLAARVGHALWLRRRRKGAWPAEDPEVKFNRVRLPPPPPEELQRLKGVAELWQRGRVSYLGELGDNADWRAWHKGKLWRYERHYHAELVALAAMALEEPGGPWLAAARELVEGWCAEVPPEQGDGWEPYPVARRVLAWAEAVALEPRLAPGLAGRLAFQLQHLLRHLEHHLRGNHLLCDAAALVAGASLLTGPGTLEPLHRGTVILEEELRRQVLPDGGFAERTAHYHAIVLRDALLALQLARERGQPPSVKEELSRMARWLVRTRRADGSWPWLNDAAPHVVPVAQDAIRRAIRMNLLDGALGGEPEPLVDLPDTGWTFLREAGSELLFERGPVGPAENPGHGHADALHYELWWGGAPVVTDSGISTYEDDAVRAFERSSQAHACVTVGGEGTDEVWRSFRVGGRARVEALPAASPDKRVRLLRGRAHAPGGWTHERALCFWPGRALLVFDRVRGAGAREVLDHVPLDPAWSAALAGSAVFLLGPGGRGLQLHALSGRIVDCLRGVETPRQGWVAQGFGQLAARTVVRLAPDADGRCAYALLAPGLTARIEEGLCVVRAPGAELRLPLADGLPKQP